MSISHVHNTYGPPKQQPLLIQSFKSREWWGVWVEGGGGYTCTNTHRIFVPPQHLSLPSCVVALSPGPPHLSVRRLKLPKGQQTAGRQVPLLSTSQTSTCVCLCVFLCVNAYFCTDNRVSFRVYIHHLDRHKQIYHGTFKMAILERESHIDSQSVSGYKSQTTLLLNSKAGYDV